MNNPEMPIFVRSFDFLSWLIPITNHFPKAQRFTVTSRLLNAAFEMREQFEAAQHRRGTQRQQALDLADESLSKVRMYLRLSHHWTWLSPGQYQHAAGMIAEIGRLLGGWKKQTNH